MLKVCCSCKEEKEVSFFSSNKNNIDKLQNECKQCNKKRIDDKVRTKEGFIAFTYKIQKQSSKKRGHRPPEYTEQELKEWLNSQILFHELFAEWKASGYNRWTKPSVDRKHNDIHYCLNNIQLMTWQENSDKQRAEDKLGNTKMCKSISQYTKDWLFVDNFKSAKLAHLATGINYGNIKATAGGLKPYAGGYIWKYE